MKENDTSAVEKDTLVNRRSLVKAAAWSVPVISLAIASPAMAASGNTEVGAFHLDGTCGVLGVLGPGFTLTAGSAPLPIGTVVTITGSGIANIGVFTPAPVIASVAVLSGTSRQITLTAALPAGATLALRTTLSISVAFALNASAALPSGYIGTGSKTGASVSSTLIFCSGT
ncbi:MULTISPECIES: hypothetical protein [Subtercola]|uniref:hypothetical protein n=1 Tax=Subtercola TaxID=120212 RepID=UPI0011AE1DDF|nr:MULTISPECIES: hypothetical protein [Subtercola]MEA9987082.1 hypothetical protein [Subtercola sp. RTI3]